MLSVEEGKVSKLMVKWASGLSDESIVLVEGVVQKSPEEVNDATIKDVELILTRVRTPAEVLCCGLGLTALCRYTWYLDWKADFHSLSMMPRAQTVRRMKILMRSSTESFWTRV
jgi:hypothetical protein